MPSIDIHRLASRKSLFGVAGEPPHEKVHLFADESTGLRAIVALHNTVRGPAFGGCRYYTYGSEERALEDALRLSRGMSLKNAMADLPFGGGKSVILRTPQQTNRAELFQLFGSLIQSLSGTYITGEDVGTTEEDLLQIGKQTSFAAGIPRAGQFGGNPSPKTALGVFASIQRAWKMMHGDASLDGVSVAIQGLGAVGWVLADWLHGAGCRLIVADVDSARAAAAHAAFGAKVVSPQEITAQPVDVLAPCALGATLNAESIPGIQAQLIAGAANNQLATSDDGEALHERGIAYLPDFLVNAGGIVSCVREYEGGATDAAVDTEVLRIADRVEGLFERASRTEMSLARAAQEWALEKLARSA
ncbi:Glu/Leu/Phe/Val dehydrogenase [Cupriavidus sp. 2TAF22]|uniref:Glu/Leu/Phe/Val family dehydrogenase n=1 Tax=unclassified Cupriavidus TaxID=2640874 RepID=UPI003F936DD9